MNKAYTTISGDMWDTVAYKAMGGSMYMDVLIKANLQYSDLYVFPAGVTLVIPDVPPEAFAGAPPWKNGETVLPWKQRGALDVE